MAGPWEAFGDIAGATRKPFTVDDIGASVRGDLFNEPGLPINYAAKPGQSFGVQATANARPFQNIVAHHTGGQTLGSALNTARHGDPFRSGVNYGYHFYIDKDGSITQGAPLDARTNHVMPGMAAQRTGRPDIFNSNSVGISFVGSGEAPTREQQAAAENLSRSLMSRYGIQPQNVVGHGEIQSNRQTGEGMPLVNAIRNGGQPVQVAQRTMSDAMPEQPAPASALKPDSSSDKPAEGPWTKFANVTDAPTKITVNPIADRFVEPERPANANAMEDGLHRMASGVQPTTPVQRMAIEHGNVLSAASQGATPNMDILRNNLISREVFEGDDGSILFRDPQTGQVVPTDNTQHIVMRDPADNTPKVYAKTDTATENPMVGAARVLAPGAMAGAPTARAAIPTANAVKPGQAVMQAANRLGIAVPRAVTTDSMAKQRVAGAVRNIPLAGDPLIAASGRAVSQMGDKAGKVASGFGGGTLAGAGSAARGGINTYITKTTAYRSKKLYDAVDELVPQSVTTPISGTRAAVDAILSRRGEAALPDGDAVAKVKEALKRGALTYNGIKTLRTNIGESIDTGILPPGMSASDLKQIYKGLTQDLNAAVAAAGPKAQSAFNRANTYHRLAAERKEALAKIVGAGGDAPVEQVFDRLLAKAGSTARADIASLAQVRKAVGTENWNEFVSGVVSQMGRNPTTRGAPEVLQSSDFSPERFLTAYSKLSKQGRQMLFSSGGKSDLASALDDLATVSSRFKELQKFSNPSGTAQTTIGGATGASVVAPMFMGDFLTPLAVVGSVVSGRVMATALSKPAAVASITKWSRTYEQLVRNPSTPRVAMLELASRNLANNLGANVNPTEFLRAIQGPMKSAADGEEPSVPRGPGQ